MKSNKSKLAILYVVALIILLPLSGCSGCSFLGPAKKEQTIAANFDIPVKDPTIRRLTEVTSHCRIKAKGTFKAGTFSLNNVPVTVTEGTSFSLDLNIPVDNPEVISTEKSLGKLHTTKQMSVAGVPLPLELELEEGKIKGEFNLGKALGAFFFNLLQVGVPNGGISGMISSLTIDEIRLDMRPDSIMTFGKKQLHIGPHSSILLKDAVVKEDLTFKGASFFDLHFLPGCKWIGEKVDCEFNGGSLQVELDIEKFKEKMHLSFLKKADTEPIRLEECTFRFGKNKRSNSTSKVGEMGLKEFWWEKSRNIDHPLMHLYSSMDMTDTNLTLKTDIHQTTGHFPEKIPGVLNADIKENSRPTEFITTGLAKAKDGKIEINTKTANLAFLLSDVSVGKVAYGKKEKLDFTLSGGTAQLNEFRCKGKSTAFNLKCGKGSTIKLPAEMLLEKDDTQNKNEPTEVRLPITLKVGNAVLNTKKGKINLEKLNGEFLITTGEQINISSDLRFALGKSSLLGGYDADIEADSLNVMFKDGDMHVDVKKCAVEVPQQALEVAIRKKIPDTFSLKLDKTVKESTSWRYRNAIVQTVEIEGFDITEMKSAGNDTLDFAAKARVLISGTVEKTGIIKRNEWEVKPWKLTGEAEGKGTVEYRFGGSKKNKLFYDLTMKVPFPDNAELDWSQVSSGLVKMAEKSVILDHLKKVVIPLKKEGELDILGNSGNLSNFEITNLELTDTAGGKQVSFSLSLLK